MTYDYTVSLVYYRHYPVKLLNGRCLSVTTGNSISILQGRHTEWGNASIVRYVNSEPMPLPDKINMVWLSILEKKTYRFDYSFDLNKAETLWNKQKNNSPADFKQILIGIAPWGKVAIWFCSYKNSVLFSWENAKEIQAKDIDSDIIYDETNIERTYNKCLLNNKDINDNFISQGIPPKSFFDNQMKQYSYRFIPLLKKWDTDNKKWVEYDDGEIIPYLNFMETRCLDSSFDKLHNGEICRYHNAGLPTNICVNWNVGKRNFCAYFFFDSRVFSSPFQRLTQLSIEGKLDFLLKIDAEQCRFVVALSCEEINKSIDFNDEMFDVIVFRNKIEFFRNKTYKQLRGAWRRL